MKSETKKSQSSFLLKMILKGVLNTTIDTDALPELGKNFIALFRPGSFPICPQYAQFFSQTKTKYAVGKHYLCSLSITVESP